MGLVMRPQDPRIPVFSSKLTQRDDVRTGIIGRLPEERQGISAATG
jgi:hypothetical protein